MMTEFVKPKQIERNREWEVIGIGHKSISSCACKARRSLYIY